MSEMDINLIIEENKHLKKIYEAAHHWQHVSDDTLQGDPEDEEKLGHAEEELSGVLDEYHLLQNKYIGYRICDASNSKDKKFERMSLGYFEAEGIAKDLSYVHKDVEFAVLGPLEEDPNWLRVTVKNGEIERWR